MKKLVLVFIFSIISVIGGLILDSSCSLVLAEEELENVEVKEGKVDTGSKGNAQDDYNVILSTEFNFSETSIQGNMKTPDGFYIQGRKAQSLEEMVKLRSSFKKELLDSLYGVESVVR